MSLYVTDELILAKACWECKIFRACILLLFVSVLMGWKLQERISDMHQCGAMFVQWLG